MDLMTRAQISSVKESWYTYVLCVVGMISLLTRLGRFEDTIVLLSFVITLEALSISIGNYLHLVRALIVSFTTLVDS
jgi:hypothetical protein